MKDKKWLSAVDVCYICHKPFGEHFIDGKTQFGRWGLMCEGCHSVVGYGLGIGKGQKYKTDTREGVDGFEGT